jgi:predicted alpha/beta-fold hydrolase
MIAVESKTASRFNPDTPFQPKRVVRAGLIQSLLTRCYPKHVIEFTRYERPVLLDAGDDETGFDTEQPVRLLGYYNRGRDDHKRRGLVLALHGWEGCSHSHYNMLMGSALLDAGYDLFRLNLRDHGPGIHANPYALNRGIFLGTLLNEVTTAVRSVAAMAGDLPFYVVGPSMGGNFALRLALRHAQNPFQNLRAVVAVSPAIDPAASTRALDAHPLYLRYFRQRWVNSLRAKERLFPELYDFSDMDERWSMYKLTDHLIRKYKLWDSADEYFHVYGVKAGDLQDLTVKTTIITAADDAVIPAAEFYSMPRNPLLDVQIHPHGGHVGFTDVLPLNHHLPAMVLAALA